MDLTIPALLLNFGALAGATIMRRPLHLRSSASMQLGPFLIAAATLAGFASIGMLLYSLGIVQGLVYWVGSAASFSLITLVLNRWDGLITIGGLCAMAAGGGLALYWLL